MKEISLRELHRRTGTWVRAARTHRVILVRDVDAKRVLGRPIPEADEGKFRRSRPFANHDDSAGDLVVGAHTVTFGALNAFAIGVGSSGR